MYQYQQSNQVCACPVDRIRLLATGRPLSAAVLQTVAPAPTPVSATNSDQRERCQWKVRLKRLAMRHLNSLPTCGRFCIACSLQTSATASCYLPASVQQREREHHLAPLPPPPADDCGAVGGSRGPSRSTSISSPEHGSRAVHRCSVSCILTFTHFSH